MAEWTRTLSEAAAHFGDRPYLIDDDRSYSFSQCEHASASTAANLKNVGMQEGDRVGIYADSSVKYAILLHAIWKLGGIACPLSTRLPSKSVRVMTEDVGCKLLIADAKNIHDRDDSSLNILSIEDLVHLEQGAGHIAPPEPIVNRPATIIFTSGSTGRPKGVLHSYDSHVYNALGSNELIPLLPGDRWLLSLPLYHVGGLAILFRTMISGATVVLTELHGDLSPTISHLSLTHLSLVPTQLHRWLKQIGPTEQFSSLKAVLLGGGPTQAHLVRAAIECGLPLYCSYGLTEMASQVTTARADLADGSGNVGKPLRYRELSLGDEGRILVKGKTLFEGYANHSELEKPTTSSGWFATSDRGEIDDKGNLRILGRIDNLFISGGENIQPEQVEAAMYSVLDVRQVMVVPLEDEEFGQVPIAFVDGDFKQAELTERLRQILPKFMIPRHFLTWPEAGKDIGIKTSRPRMASLAASVLGGA